MVFGGLQPQQQSLKKIQIIQFAKVKYYQRFSIPRCVEVVVVVVGAGVVGRGLHGIGAWAPFGSGIGFSGHKGNSGRGVQGIGHLKGGLHKGVSGHKGNSGRGLQGIGHFRGGLHKGVSGHRGRFEFVDFIRGIVAIKAKTEHTTTKTFILFDLLYYLTTCLVYRVKTTIIVFWNLYLSNIWTVKLNTKIVC